MHEKDEKIELTEEEARLANFYPRFPIGKLSMAIKHMRLRQAELQSIAEDSQPSYGGSGHMEPISRYAFQLGQLIDDLEQLR